MKKMFNTRFVVVSSVILLAVLSRLIPHEANFTPVMALALFAGSYIKDKRLAFLVPLGAMFISDLIIGFHGAALFVYIGVSAGVVVGFFLRKNIGILTVAGSALLSSVIFYLISNFGYWIAFYNVWTLESLFVCYADAIPFFRTELISTLLLSGIFFGGFEFAGKYIPAIQEESRLA